jgi:hypothetical protein
MRFLASLTTLSVAVLTLAGCPAGTPMCPPDGTGFNEGTGLYCAYGVVVGGFRNCPTDLPNRFDFADGSFVCSSRPIGSRGDIPEPVCRMLAACAGERVPLPRAMCGVACSMDRTLAPPGYDPATTCYDGCNWCTCYFDGLDDCTARFCFDADVSPDAGPLDVGPSDAGPSDVGPSDVGMLGDVTLLCGSSTCRGDQLCRGTNPGTDGGTPSYACVPLPPSCVGVADCMFCSDPAQRACLQDVCMFPQGSISSGGRLIVCPGA